MAYQREGNAQNQNCESGKAPEEPVALLQAAKACKGHRVNKFGHWPVGIALLPVLCFPSPQSNLGLQKLTDRAIMQVASIDCELGETSLQRVFPPNGSQFYACRAPPFVAEAAGHFGLADHIKARHERKIVGVWFCVTFLNLCHLL